MDEPVRSRPIFWWAQADVRSAIKNLGPDHWPRLLFETSQISPMQSVLWYPVLLYHLPPNGILAKNPFPDKSWSSIRHYPCRPPFQVGGCWYHSVHEAVRRQLILLPFLNLLFSMQEPNTCYWEFFIHSIHKSGGGKTGLSDFNSS